MQPLSQNACMFWMVKPALFFSNPQTASSNSFQKTFDSNLHEQAMLEFDRMVDLLALNKVSVFISQSKDEKAPDAIFPNNWISFHHDKSIVKYPMMAENRRRERNIDLPISPDHVVDFSSFENEGIYLEGTGSIVFDHIHRKAYASESVRTDFSLLSMVCDELNYTPVQFSAVDYKGLAIYHTNVIMHIGNGYVVIALDAISSLEERAFLVDSFTADGLEIIMISLEQMNSFAGNMLQIINEEGEKITICSMTAFDSLSLDQVELLQSHSSLLPIDVRAIELLGGGSVRCMIAEIF